MKKKGKKRENGEKEKEIAWLAQAIRRPTTPFHHLGADQIGRHH
jgi:hypothetical protein